MIRPWKSVCFLVLALLAASPLLAEPRSIVKKGTTQLTLVSNTAPVGEGAPAGNLAWSDKQSKATFRIVSDGYTSVPTSYIVQYRIGGFQSNQQTFPLGPGQDPCSNWKTGEAAEVVQVSMSAPANHAEGTFTVNMLPAAILSASHPAAYSVGVRVVPAASKSKIVALSNPSSFDCYGAPSAWVTFQVPGIYVPVIK